MLNRKKYIALALFISISYESVAENQDLFSLSLEELMSVEVSGATFSGDTLRSVPASVTVFTAKEIQQLGFRYLHELTNFVPGFQSKRQGSSTHIFSYSARGRQVGSGTRSVKLIVNGQPWTNGYIESSVSTVPIFPLFNVSQVEFVRGAGSVLHGSGAMMASINVTTQEGAKEVQLGWGDWGATNSGFQYSNNGWTFDLWNMAHDGTDYQLKNIDDATTLPSSDPLSQQYLYVAKKEGRWGFNYAHHILSTQGYYSGSRVNDQVNRSSRRYDMLHVDYQLYGSSYHDVNIELFSNYFNLNFGSELTGVGALGSPITNPESNEKSHIYLNTTAKQHGLRILNDWVLINGHWSLGFEWSVDEPVDNRAASNFDFEALSNQEIPIEYSPSDTFEFEVFEAEENQKFAIFSEYEYRLSDKINTISSFRMDYFTRIDDGALSPRLGVVYHYSDATVFKLILNQAFRGPGSLELGTKNNPSLLGNPDLKPERIQSAEMIYLYQRDTYSLIGSYFYNNIIDGIEQVSIGGVRQFLNTDETHNEGIEIEFKWEVNEQLRINGVYSKTLSELETAFRLSKEYGSLILFFNHGSWLGSLSSYYHSGSKLKYGSEFLPLSDIWHHNLSISYHHSDDMVSSFSINNLKDRQYETANIGQLLDVGIPAQGRFVDYQIGFRF